MESNLKPSRKWDKTFKEVGHFLQGNIPQRPRYRFTVVYIVKNEKVPSTFHRVCNAHRHSYLWVEGGVTSGRAPSTHKQLINGDLSRRWKDGGKNKNVSPQ
jgi:hypothetical protein